MNFYQSLNASTASFIVAAAAISTSNYFSRMLLGSDSSGPFCICMAIFFVLFAVKSGLDDHGYFIIGNAPSFEQFIGIIVTAITRIIFAISAYSLQYPSVVFELITVSFLLLSLWIIVHIIRVSYFKHIYPEDSNLNERGHWLVWNFCYALPGLVFFMITTSVALAQLMAILMLGLVLIDIVQSKTYLKSPRNSL